MYTVAPASKAAYCAGFSVDLLHIQILDAETHSPGGQKVVLASPVEQPAGGGHPQPPAGPQVQAPPQPPLSQGNQ